VRVIKLILHFLRTILLDTMFSMFSRSVCVPFFYKVVGRWDVKLNDWLLSGHLLKESADMDSTLKMLFGSNHHYSPTMKLIMCGMGKFCVA
jgi:hypothetical protein